MSWNQHASTGILDLAGAFPRQGVAIKPRHLSPIELNVVRHEAAQRLEEAQEKADEVAALCARASQVCRMRNSPRTGLRSDAFRSNPRNGQGLKPGASSPTERKP